MRRKVLTLSEVWTVGILLSPAVLLIGRVVLPGRQEATELLVPLVVLVCAYAAKFAVPEPLPPNFNLSPNKEKFFEVVATGLTLALVAYQPVARYPDLWHGFGISITLLLIVMFAILKKSCGSREFEKRHRTSLSVLAVLLLGGVYLPSMVQPQWAFVNLGDASHQVLEEISGPLVGHFPGVNFVSTYTTLLGVPLSIMRTLPIGSSAQLFIVVAWTNLLTLAVPTLMLVGARWCVGTRLRAIPALLVCAPLLVSGNWGSAASNVESLSMIPGRTIFPVALGVLLAMSMRTEGFRLFVSVGLLCTLTAYNNVEFGVPAAIGALLTVLIVQTSSIDIWRRITHIGLGVVLGLGALATYSLVVSGPFDIWYRIGSYAGKPYSPKNVFPVWSTHNLLLALFMSAIVTGILFRRDARIASITGIYFGSWGLLSFPYCSYRCESEMYMSTQIYLVPAIMCGFSIFGIYWSGLLTSRCREPHFRITQTIPLLLAALALASVLQAPNPLDEWRRVTGRAETMPWATDPDRALPNKWEVGQIDWIQTDSLKEIASGLGSVSVGYFGHMGNSVQLATGIANLTRINSAEVLQIKGTTKLRELACREVDEKQPQYLIVVGIEFPCQGYLPANQTDSSIGIRLLVRSER